MAKQSTQQGVVLLGKNDTEHIFHLDPRYELKKAKILGAGSFGVVCSAFDRVRNETIAVKKLSVYCGDEWDAQHVLREVRMLKLFSSHPNVSSITHSLSLNRPHIFCIVCQSICSECRIQCRNVYDPGIDEYGSIQDFAFQSIIG